MASYSNNFAPVQPARHPRWQGDHLMCPKCGRELAVKAGGENSKRPGAEYVTCSNYRGAPGCGFFNYADQDQKFGLGAPAASPRAQQPPAAVAIPDSVAIALADINAKLDRLLAVRIDVEMVDSDELSEIERAERRAKRVKK